MTNGNRPVRPGFSRFRGVVAPARRHAAVTRKYSRFVPEPRSCHVVGLPPAVGAAGGKRVRRPVSRVLSRASRPLDGHSSGTPVAGRLARPTRAESAGTRLLPRPCRPSLAGLDHQPSAPIRSCSRWGLPCRGRCRRARCALAAPFHPCLQPLRGEGGLFSVALSLGSPPPGVTRHRVPVEPGLSSTGVAPDSGRPAVWHGAHAPARPPRQPPAPLYSPR